MASGAMAFVGETLSTIKEAGEIEPSPSPLEWQIKLIQIMQITHFLAWITGHSMRRKEKVSQRWSTWRIWQSENEIRNGGEQRGFSGQRKEGIRGGGVRDNTTSHSRQ